MSRQRPGFPDLNFGRQGIADIPPEPPRDPDYESLPVGPLDNDGNGKLSFCGWHSDDSSTRLFTRVLQDGRWDDATGHVPIAPRDDLPDASLTFSGLLSTTIDGKERIYCVGSSTYYTPDEALEHISVARLDDKFQPVQSFGNDGIATPHPGEPWESVQNGKATGIAQPKADTNVSLYSALRPMALVNGALRVVFPQVHFVGRDIITRSWIGLFNPDDGKLVEDLGEAKDQGVLRLHDKAGRPIRVLRAHFFDDGGLLALAATEDENERVILMRYDRHGVPLQSFAEGGERNLFSHQPGMRLGMDVNDERIVISRAMDRQLTEGSTVFCVATEDGKNDPTFNAGQSVTLRRDGGGLVLGMARLDQQNRIVLAGAFLTGVNVGKLNVARLTQSGELDSTFGENGFYISDPYLYTASELYVSEEGIRVVSMLPPSDAPLLERVIKLHA